MGKVLMGQNVRKSHQKILEPTYFNVEGGKMAAVFSQ
jgi:hypothetical protein